MDVKQTQAGAAAAAAVSVPAGAGAGAGTGADPELMVESSPAPLASGTGTASFSFSASASATAVVDDELRVLGVKRLRVADASVMPHIPSGPVAATCMAVGVAAFEFIVSYSSSAGYGRTETERDMKICEVTQ